jgi:gas vesicle protein
VTVACKFWPVMIVPLAMLVLFHAGCGESATFHPETQYTAESLAQELAFRFNALSPSGKTARRARRPGKKAVDSKADERSPTKSQSKAATKKELPKTVDDVLDDIEAKIRLIKDRSPSEVVTRMIEALSKDSSLNESDRQMLDEKLKELRGSG